ncbi:MAG: tetratricopeptide repeat protein [Actinomycetota bacterium]
MPDQRGQASETLRPYLPRLAIQWLAESPGETVREIDGTLVFVDISGFTKMSERLARKGKVGAEEVTDVLASVFGRLLAVAYGNGGGLIKFGGDALLLLFDGNDHAARGARAAAGMRSTLRSIGPISSSAGSIRLKMSVGVHSGTFHFFLVGDSHRELIITGPGASRTVLMEGTAEAGEVLVSDATAALLPASVLGDRKGEGTFLKREPPGLVPAQSVPDVAADEVDVAEGVPVAVRAHLLSGATDSEHRRATVAFVHFDGVDEIVEQRGADELATGLQALVVSAQRAAEEHGVTFLGTDLDKDGGKIILVAGVPQAVGDDDERMLLALRSIMDAAPPISTRIGVNAGHIFAGDIGPAYRKTYTVMGDAVNLAARLMARAEPGQIIATAGVLDASSVAFRTDALEPFMVKGKRDPVTAFVVGDAIGSKKVESDDLPLAGRADELKTLTAALEDARNGSGAVTEIVGDSGLGKTRLLTEVRGLASGFRIMDAACERYQAATAYLPFRRILRDALDIEQDAGARAGGEQLRDRVLEFAPELEPWLPLIALAVDVDTDPTPEVDLLDAEFRRPKLEETVGLLLSKVLDGPTFFALEDVHWMDEASSDLLSHLARSALTHPWMFCATRRDVETGFRATAIEGATTVRLEALTPAETHDLVRSATEEAPLRPHEMETLAERSGGNPLFLLELVEAARLAGNVEGLPGSIEGIVIAQIDRLAPPDRRLLRFASVLGLSFADTLIETTLETEPGPFDPGAWRRLDDFLVSDGDGAHRFRHALMRDAAYEGLPYRRRRELHARVGEAIVQQHATELEDHAEILSMHFFSAQRFGESWVYSRIAGDRSKAKFAISQAVEFYERALGSAKRIEELSPIEVGELHETVGDLREQLGQYGDASAAYTEARAAFRDDPARQAGLLLKQSQSSDRAGRDTEALRWLTRGIRLLEGRTDEESLRQHARLICYYGAVRQSQGRHAEAIRLLKQAMTESERAGDRHSVAYAYGLLDWALIESGEEKQPVYMPRALEIYEELEDLPWQAFVLNNLGVLAQWTGRWDEAVDLLQRAGDIRTKLGGLVDAAFCDSNRAEILSDRGQLDEAEEIFTEALRVHKAASFLTGIGFATSNLGRVAARRGRYDEAAELYDQARAVFAEAGLDSEILETDLRSAELMLMQERSKDAGMLAENGLERVRSLGGAVQEPGFLRVRGYALMQDSDLDAAEAAFRESLAAAREREAEFEVALTLDAMVRLGELRGTPADEEATEARDIFERLRVTAVPSVPVPPVPRRSVDA